MYITVASWLMMFISGIIESIKSLLVPYFQEHMALSASQTGVLLSVSFYGVVLTNLMIGIFFNRAPIKRIMFYSLTVMTVGLAGFSLDFPFLILILLMLILGSGISGVGIASNTVTAVLHPMKAGQMFIILHAFFGIGALIGPIVVQGVLGVSSWPIVFIGLAAVPVFLFAFIFNKQIPSAKMGKLQFSDIKLLLRERLFYIFIALKFCYVGAELGFVTWIIGFFREEHLFSPEKAALFVSLFFASFTVGRLMGSFIVERVGYFRMLILHSLLALLSIAITVYGPSHLMWVFIVYGFSLSIIFPTITTIASSVYAEKISAVFGFLYAAAGLGGALTTWLIGLVYDSYNYRTAFLIPLIMMAFIVVLILLLKRLVGNRLTSS